MNDAAAREQEDTETGAAGHGLRVPFSGDEGRRGSVGETARAPASETPRAPAVRRRLAKLIAAKLALDLVFVGAFALYTHAVTFGRGFDGALEHADGRGAVGWVIDLERVGEPVEVQLFENGRFVASTVADELRTDTDPETTHSAGRRRFTFEFDRVLDGDREIRVYAVRAERAGARRTVQQFGEPIRFAWK